MLDKGAKPTTVIEQIQQLVVYRMLLQILETQVLIP